MKYVDEKQNPYLFQRINKELRIFNNAIYINSTLFLKKSISKHIMLA